MDEIDQLNSFTRPVTPGGPVSISVIMVIPTERRPQVNYTEFKVAHENCVITMRAYVVEAEKTAAMFAKCTAAPLSFAARFNLLSQEIVENDAHLSYLGSKRVLRSAARLGYGVSN